MLKKLSFVFLVSLVVLFSGCSQKDVEVTEEGTNQPQAQQDKKQEEAKQDTVAQGETTSDAQNTEGETTTSVSVPELDTVYFDYDKFVIRADMRGVVSQNENKLKESGYDNMITLEGHCDERGSNEYNFALGLKRAVSVKNELIEAGVNPSNIKTISYGENQPLCTEKNEGCWSKNRRVEYKLEK